MSITTDSSSTPQPIYWSTTERSKPLSNDNLSKLSENLKEIATLTTKATKLSFDPTNGVIARDDSSFRPLRSWSPVTSWDDSIANLRAFSADAAARAASTQLIPSERTTIVKEIDDAIQGLEALKGLYNGLGKSDNVTVVENATKDLNIAKSNFTENEFKVNITSLNDLSKNKNVTDEVVIKVATEYKNEVFDILKTNKLDGELSNRPQMLTNNPAETTLLFCYLRNPTAVDAALKKIAEDTNAKELPTSGQRETRIKELIKECPELKELTNTLNQLEQEKLADVIQLENNRKQSQLTKEQRLQTAANLANGAASVALGGLSATGGFFNSTLNFVTSPTVTDAAVTGLKGTYNAFAFTARIMGIGLGAAITAASTTTPTTPTTTTTASTTTASTATPTTTTTATTTPQPPPQPPPQPAPPSGTK